ncbi:unnamed protein product [Gadus morhua 'NCC']
MFSRESKPPSEAEGMAFKHSFAGPEFWDQDQLGLTGKKGPAWGPGTGGSRGYKQRCVWGDQGEVDDRKGPAWGQRGGGRGGGTVASWARTGQSDRKEACVDSRISGARNSQRLSPRWTWRPAERQMDGRPLSARCSHPPAPQPPTAGIDAGREPQRSAGISVDVRTPSRVAVSELNSAGEAF